MTKLEELKAASDAAFVAWINACAAAQDAAVKAAAVKAWYADAADAAYDAHAAELEKQEEKQNES